MDSTAAIEPKVTTSSKPRFYQRLSFEEVFWGWLFILPAVIGLVGFRLGPLTASLALSFTKYDIISSPKWIGLANYGRLVDDRLWIRSVEVTL